MQNKQASFMSMINSANKVLVDNPIMKPIFNASFAALNLAKIESQKLGHKTFSMQSIKMLHYNDRLLKQFLFNSALKLSSDKFRTAFNKACQFGVIAS